MVYAVAETKMTKIALDEIHKKILLLPVHKCPQDCAMLLFRPACYCRFLMSLGVPVQPCFDEHPCRSMAPASCKEVQCRADHEGGGGRHPAYGSIHMAQYVRTVSPKARALREGMGGDTL